MAGITTTAVLGIVDKSALVALEYLKGKNIDKSKEYIDKYFKAKTKLLEEKGRANDDQWDNVVESYEEAVSTLLDIVHMDQLRNGVGGNA